MILVGITLAGRLTVLAPDTVYATPDSEIHSRAPPAARAERRTVRLAAAAERQRTAVHVSAHMLPYVVICCHILSHLATL